MSHSCRRFRYIAFDVETPNSKNNRMSSIGVAVIENGRLVDRFSSHINPEQDFDAFNIHLTGITPAKVRYAPTFQELWERTLAPLFSSGILIAHNAPFDMKVLSQCLNDYRLPFSRYALYGCTVKMGKKVFPYLPNHSLSTLCNHLHIPLNHHQADSDSIACGKLLLHYMQQDFDIKKSIRSYDLKLGKTVNLMPPGW